MQPTKYSIKRLLISALASLVGCCGASIGGLPGPGKGREEGVKWLSWGVPDQLAFPKTREIEELYVKKDYESCITLMEGVKDHMANSSQFWSNLGVAHFRQGEIVKAQECVAKAEELLTISPFPELWDTVSQNSLEISRALRRETLKLSGL